MIIIAVEYFLAMCCVTGGRPCRRCSIFWGKDGLLNPLSYLEMTPTIAKSTTVPSIGRMLHSCSSRLLPSDVMHGEQEARYTLLNLFAIVTKVVVFLQNMDG